jgi:hypothetical protein
MAVSTTAPPVVLSAAGAQPTPPATLLQALIELVTQQAPGYTADLPGSIIEDIAGTDTLALVLIDQTRVELINSLTPLGANEFLLNQLGQQAGLMLGQPTNTSVDVIFTVTANSTAQPGYVIPTGFMVSDGSQQYVIDAPGGITGAEGTTQPLTATAVNPGTWSVPSGSVDQVVSSFPSPYLVTVTNPNAGIPGNPNPETWQSYRARVLQAGIASAQSMPSMVRTLLNAVPGVTARLISILTPASGNWLILVGGGDEYQIAYALFQSVTDITTLVGSINTVTAVTVATNGEVTTALYHGLTVGGAFTISGANPVNYDVTGTVESVIDDYHFTISTNTSGFPSYVDSGVLTPNPRNVSVSIVDYPDTYQVTFANPLQQVVTGTVAWNTTAPNFTQAAAIQQAAVPALVAYVNSIFAGQQINLFELQAAFQTATSGILPNALLTRMVFSISIDGVGVSPESGTGIFPSDPQSYLFAAANSFTVTQG